MDYVVHIWAECFTLIGMCINSTHILIQNMAVNIYLVNIEIILVYHNNILLYNLSVG